MEQSEELLKIKQSMSGFKGSPMGRKATNARDLIKLWKIRQRQLGKRRDLEVFDENWKEMYSYADVIWDIRKMQKKEFEVAQKEMLKEKKKQYIRYFPKEKSATGNWQKLKEDILKNKPTE